MTTKLVPSTSITVAAPTIPALEAAIAGWLDEKQRRSGSQITYARYRDGLLRYRQHLLDASRDLDSYPTPQQPQLDPRSLKAQEWAGHDQPAASTYNNRLAIISSFYKYALRHGFLSGDNPIDKLARSKVEAYRAATALPLASVRAKLKEIDTATSTGARDTALLLVFLETARRLAEVASLRWGNLRQEGNRLHLTFSRTKGGKSKQDLLSTRTSHALMRYLGMVYGVELGSLPASAPVWVPISSHKHSGQPLTSRSIARIVAQRLGESKVHALRHTAAVMLLHKGANLVEIQRQLGHANAATTSLYLASIQVAANPYAEQIAADLLGDE